jgi:UDP-N-acetylmuramoyl-tripeptide--D-alanyl-D-alanine ligase
VRRSYGGAPGRMSGEPVAVTAGELAQAAGGRLVGGDGGRVIGGISIDSRTVASGDLFFAIRGERFDGHAFVDAAFERDAAGVVVSDTAAVARGPEGAIVVLVGDTTAALQAFARHVRRASGAKVVAITGSAGKTTTKEIAAEFLSARYRVFRNKGNLNNHIGLPLSLLELRGRPEVAVVELGMNHAGEIRTLVGIAEPNVRVWTNVGDAHMGFFASADAIADAKAEILEKARPSDVLVANADDERVMAHARRFTGKVVTFGIDRQADVRAADVTDHGVDGTSARLMTNRGEARIETPLVGRGNLANVLAAAAVALDAEVPLAEIVARAATLSPAPRRGMVLRLPGGVTVLDDSYNSSPAALRRALETLRSTTGRARKGAILGEMLELGDHAIRLHRACGEAAAAAGLAWLVTVGGAPAGALGEAAVTAGLPAASVRHAATASEAAEIALSFARPGDLVLVKGSRGIGVDRVTDRLAEAFG